VLGHVDADLGAKRLWKVQACVPLARLALRLWLTA
jgi:hypothetical protein